MVGVVKLRRLTPCHGGRYKIARMTPDEVHELEQRMDALAREYAKTHDPAVKEELTRRARELSSFTQSESPVNPKKH